MTIRLLSRARHSLTWSFSLLKSYSYFKTQLKSQAQLQISIERCAASLGSKEHIGWILNTESFHLNFQCNYFYIVSLPYQTKFLQGTFLFIPKLSTATLATLQTTGEYTHKIRHLFNYLAKDSALPSLQKVLAITCARCSSRYWGLGEKQGKKIYHPQRIYILKTQVVALCQRIHSEKKAYSFSLYGISKWSTHKQGRLQNCIFAF